MTCFKGLPAESLGQYGLGLYLNKPQDIRTKALWIDKTKVETNASNQLSRTVMEE